MSGKEPQYIFGMHDRGGESEMTAKGKQGWLLITEETGHDPTHTGGTNYSGLSDQGFGVIVRLNNGYKPRGTLPKSAHYEDFATRCANWVAGSAGCQVWIIGNEMNYQVEWPQEDGNPERITPTRYARCYRLCRDKIKSLPGHENDQVVVGAVAPWNIDAGMGWIEYFADILNRLQGKCDGIAIHTYTHGSGVDLISSTAKMDPPYQDRHYNFYAYKDFMNAIPQSMRDLPVYITETDEDVAWLNENNGWVQAAYQEIANWNDTPGNQQIRCLILYRWRGDKWSIHDKGGVLDDWRDAMQHEYVWHPKPKFDERLETYTVKAGDTLAQIAKRIYGDAKLHEIIANANGILDPSFIRVGQVLVIPTLREEMPEVKPEDFGLSIEMIGSPFFNKRKERPLVIINHATANSSLDGLSKWFRDERAQVSAHFGVGKDGTVVQYVDEAMMAWHAGVSEWLGREHVNWFSLGIELVNLNNGTDPYPEAQHEANVALNAYLCVKWGITPDAQHIVTHRETSGHLTGKNDPLGYDMDRLRREVAALVAEHSDS